MLWYVDVCMKTALFNSLYKIPEYDTVQINFCFLSRFLEHMIKIQMQICGEKLPSLERN
jgi:hypothetical protein